MAALSNKIDFVGFISVEHANPNGDPLNGNRPRDTVEGEISDVCIKRKLRNRLQDFGERVFVQSDDRKDDGCKSLKDRLDSDDELKKLSRGKTKDEDVFQKKACEKWIDVRAFGQLFAFGDEKSGSVSSGIRGPVSLHPAFSIDPIEIESIQITKSVDGTSSETRSSEFISSRAASTASLPKRQASAMRTRKKSGKRLPRCLKTTAQPRDPTAVCAWKSCSGSVTTANRDSIPPQRFTAASRRKSSARIPSPRRITASIMMRASKVSYRRSLSDDR